MIERTLDAPQPLDVRLTLGVAQTGQSGTQGWWATHTPEGPATLHLVHDAPSIVARAWGPGATWVLEQAPALLGFRDRPEEFDPAHPLLRDLHKRMGGLRIGRTDRVFEAIVPTVLGQKVATKEAHRNARALIRKYGEPAPGPGSLILPVAPQVLADLPYWELHELGIERHRADLLRFLAARATRLEEISTMTREEGYRRLTAFPGVGPWTAAGVMAVALGDADAVPVGDYHLPNTVSWALAGEPRGDDRKMLELLEPYRGQRGRVIRLLKAGHVHAPKYGPRTAIRSISRI